MQLVGVSGYFGIDGRIFLRKMHCWCCIVSFSVFPFSFSLGMQQIICGDQCTFVTAGELGKMEMLHKGILHKCIHQLLEKKKNTPVRELTKDLECLCKIMSTVGPQLDTVKAKVGWLP